MGFNDPPGRPPLAGAKPLDWQAVFRRHLEPLLGAQSAQMAVKTAAEKALKKAPEELQLAEMPKLLEHLKPILSTLVGSAHTTIVVNAIRIGLEKR